MKYKYIPTKFEALNISKKVNDEFIRCTISVLGLEQVANNTLFNRVSVDKALPTMDYIPVIGYMEDGEFQGHGQEIILKDNGGLEFVIKTIPYGVVIKDTARYEELTHLNGTKEEYLVVDCYIWKRYIDDIDKINSLKQSMEISVNDALMNENNVMQITDFTFSALCMLGVTPAFDLAKIRTIDKFAKSEFKAQYSEMIGVLDKYLNDNTQEGGITMQDEIQEIVEVEEITETAEVITEEVVEFVETVEEKTEDIIEEFTEVVEEVVETIEEDVAIEETVVENVVEINEYEVKVSELETKISEYETKITELEVNFTELQSKFTVLETENVRLSEFEKETFASERKIQEEELFETYKELDGVEEYELIKKDTTKFEKVSEMEKEIALLYIKNKVNFSKNENKSKKIPVAKKSENESVYGDLFERYSETK